jgi:transcriptional regulator with XRE-family HTH domain
MNFDGELGDHLPDGRSRLEKQVALTEALRECYDNSSLRQVDLAAALDVSQSVISDWLRGVSTPDVLRIVEMDGLFNRPAGYLLFAAGLLPPELAPFYKDPNPS